MRVYVVRHGDAIPPRGGGERALTPAGMRDAEAAGRLLAAEGFDRILFSPKLRTRQTTEHILSAAADIDSQEDLSLLPPSTEQSVANAVERCGAGAVVLVSHLPLVAELVAWFVAGESREYPLVGFPPAGVVALDMDVVGRGMATLAWHAFPPDFSKH